MIRVPGLGFSVLWKPALGISPRIGLYADVPSSLTTSSNLVSAWGVASQATSNARPELITDSVTGGKAVRFDVGKTLALAAGAADFMHQGPCTGFVIWRSRLYQPAPNQVLPILDSSADGAGRGYQLRAYDHWSDGNYRQVRARISNGTTWVLEHPGEGFANGPFNSFIPLKWNVTCVVTTPTRLLVNVDRAVAIDDVLSVTLPTGSAGPLVIGGSQIDIRAIEIFDRELAA